MKRAMVNTKEDNHGWEVNSGNVIGGLPDMKLDMEFSTAANLNYSVLQTLNAVCRCTLAKDQFKIGTVNQLTQFSFP